MDINLLREREKNNAFTVSELNGYIKDLLDTDRILSSVTVRGEISNFTLHRSGHLYFSLKDTEGQIKCVMFRSSAARLKFMPESGMKVIAHGSVSAFVRDGTYQLYVSSLQPDGIGALYLAYEQLKAKLAEQGLFDQRYKKPIPGFPSKIGVVTSPTGAAVRDILNVTKRRYPLADVLIYPALVQGASAAASVRRGVEYLDNLGEFDVIIVGRGGGSIEDLWAFNDEALARAIFDAKTPIISAVGHETDFTICDFVSDLRAPTPSAAAEIAVPDVREIMMRIDSCEQRSSIALKSAVARARMTLEKLCTQVSGERFAELLTDRKERLELIGSRLVDAIEGAILSKRAALVLNAEKCNALSPLAVLKRGYSIAEVGGSTVNSVSSVKKSDEISVRLADGKIKATVTEIEEGNPV